MNNRGVRCSPDLHVFEKRLPFFPCFGDPAYVVGCQASGFQNNSGVHCSIPSACSIVFLTTLLSSDCHATRIAVTGPQRQILKKVPEICRAPGVDSDLSERLCSSIVCPALARTLRTIPISGGFRYVTLLGEPIMLSSLIILWS